MAAGKFNADPTKEFFISMLTRDIPLERAIMDLIDNSIDGAKTSLIKKGIDFNEHGYSNCKAEIFFNDSEFVIKDNCGGFSKQAAYDYVFRIGRPENQGNDNENSTGTVGRFGVGMKRALFKIGWHFIVESKCGGDHFIVEEDVNDWENETKGAWEFDFYDVDGSSVNLSTHVPVLIEDGTYIKVTKLNEGVKQDFNTSNYKNKIIKEFEKTFNYGLDRGFLMEVNTVMLKSNPIQLLVSEVLNPYFIEEIIEDVNVKIFAGVGEPNPNLAGWYIYCNDRLMVDKDTTNLTGWDGGKKFYDDSGVQKYHNKVAMFRGIVFFSSNQSDKLPMTTTKWGIDVNSTIYKQTRDRMIFAMKAVLSDLNRLDNAEQRSAIVNNSSLVDVVAYQDENKTFTDQFIFPEIKKTNFDDGKTKVEYRVETKLLSAVKKHLRVTTAGAVGQATYDYYVKMKELENE